MCLWQIAFKDGSNDFSQDPLPCDHDRRIYVLTHIQLCNPMNCSPPGSSVHGIFRQEYWSGLPFPTSGHLPNPGIESVSLVSALAGGFFTTAPPGKPMVYVNNGILLSHKKNEMMPFAATWMQLETIILSEISQKEKNKYHMNLLTCRI